MQWSREQPIYRQIRNEVVAAIIDGNFAPGQMLPSVRQMAIEANVNPLTVAKAYAELTDLDIVEKQRGLGMVVRENASATLLAMEREKFFAREWPRIVSRAQLLGVDLAELVAGTDANTDTNTKGGWRP